MPGMTSWVSVGGGAFREESRAPTSSGLALGAVPVVGVPNSDVTVARERAVSVHVVGLLHHLCHPPVGLPSLCPRESSRCSPTPSNANQWV